MFRLFSLFNQLSRFRRKWRLKNGHNGTVPQRIFPINRVKVGRYSYGKLDVITYNVGCLDMVVIGNFVSISDDVRFLLDEHHQTKTYSTFPFKSILFEKQFPGDAVSRGDIFIGDEVWIGQRVTILSGVKVGKGAIIATGSVVVQDIPPYSVAAGVPAKVVKKRFDDKTIDRLMNIDLSDVDKATLIDSVELLYEFIDDNVLASLEAKFSSGSMKNE